MSKILIGYWRNEQNPQYPDPNNLISPKFWEEHNKEYIISYLDKCTPCNHYRGFSTCRICGEMLGTFERTDGKFVWPDKLSHYVKEHDVKLPTLFIEHVMKDDEPTGLEENFWIRWGKVKEGKIPNVE